MDHFRNDPLSTHYIFRLCFVLTTMKPPFRMPFFVPLNPSPVMETIDRWNPRDRWFSQRNLHDPFVDVFFPFVDYIWLVVDLPLWKMMEFVNGKYDIPYIIENKIHVPVTTKQYFERISKDFPKSPTGSEKDPSSCCSTESACPCHSPWQGVRTVPWHIKGDTKAGRSGFTEFHQEILEHPSFVLKNVKCF